MTNIKFDEPSVVEVNCARPEDKQFTPALKIMAQGKDVIGVIGETTSNARHSSIEIGDLLTTSSTSGYAMKAVGSIKVGVGMMPKLVALQ